MQIARIISGAVVLEEDRVTVVRDDADCKVIYIDSSTKYYEADASVNPTSDGGAELCLLFGITDETLYVGPTAAMSTIVFDSIPNPTGRSGRWEAAATTGRYSTTVFLVWIDTDDEE